MLILKRISFCCIGLFLILVSCGSSQNDKVDSAVPELNHVSDTQLIIDVRDSFKNIALIDSSNNPDKHFTNIRDEQLIIDTSKTKVKVNATSRRAAYDLERHVEMWSLNSDLVEISGLSMTETGAALVGINDEKGIIFKLNKSDGTIESKWKFGKHGDYEGIEVINGIYYIIKSNGNIYKYDPIAQTTEIIKTPLSLTNDVEGLGQTLDGGKLLMACKGQSTIGKGSSTKKKKSVYAYDLKLTTFQDKPFLTVHDDVLLDWVESNINADTYTKKELKAIKHRLKSFAPSGIATHPIDNDIYIISTHGKLLIVLNNQQEIERIYLLNQKIHTQPEGICFAANGDLYISNEGKGLLARIYRYKMNN